MPEASAIKVRQNATTFLMGFLPKLWMTCASVRSLEADPPLYGFASTNGHRDVVRNRDTRTMWHFMYDIGGAMWHAAGVRHGPRNTTPARHDQLLPKPLQRSP